MSQDVRIMAPSAVLGVRAPSPSPLEGQSDDELRARVRALYDQADALKPAIAAINRELEQREANAQAGRFIAAMPTTIRNAVVNAIAAGAGAEAPEASAPSTVPDRPWWRRFLGGEG